MRIGVFDSGLGGLAIGRAIMERLPKYDYIFLGDTKRVPYGNRSQETIHQFTSEAVSFLFKHDCQLIIIACNTASAESLRKSQQEYLPTNYPDRRILGVIIPTAEEAVRSHPSKVGVLATTSTVESGAYLRELKRQSPEVEVVQQAAPLLVPLVEFDGMKFVERLLYDYVPFIYGCQSLILGCTHYCLIKDKVRELASKMEVNVVSQDEVVPEKLAGYLGRHPEIESKLAKSGDRRYCVTDLTSGYRNFAAQLAGEELPLEVVQL